jgi:hypothetical protein
MAEHHSVQPAELGAPMDYAEHERTYAGFVALTKILVLASVIVLMALALYGFGAGGFWLGTLLIVLMIVGSVVGLVGRGTSTPLVVVAGIGLLFMALSLG